MLSLHELSLNQDQVNEVVDAAPISTKQRWSVHFSLMLLQFCYCVVSDASPKCGIGHGAEAGG